VLVAGWVERPRRHIGNRAATLGRLTGSAHHPATSSGAGGG
jgi:hypothetical protein